MNGTMKAPVAHGFVGEMVEVGESVTGFQVGDRVISEQIVPCGTHRFSLDQWKEAFAMAEKGDYSSKVMLVP